MALKVFFNFSGLRDEKESLKKDLTEFKNNTEESLKHLEHLFDGKVCLTTAGISIH